MSVLLLAAPPVCRASLDFPSAPSMHPLTSPPPPSHREVAAAAASRAILGLKAASPPPLLLPGSLHHLCCALLRASPLLSGSRASKGAAAAAVATAEAEAATCRPLTRRPPVTARSGSRGRSRGSRAANNTMVRPVGGGLVPYLLRSLRSRSSVSLLCSSRERERESALNEVAFSP